MANKHQMERENLSRNREQPEGWFDPETYRSNMEYRNPKSNYQQTNNPNLVNRYDDKNRHRAQNQYSDRTAFDHQYGNGRYDSRNTYNDYANTPSARYSDSFDEGYSARSNHRDHRDTNMENRSGMANRFDDRSRMYDRDNSGYGNEDRNWWDRTSDEVSSWFGDDDAERRRRMDKMKGPHSGKGPKGYIRTDEKLKDDISEKLYHDSYIDASDIDVQVQNGEATLTGTVDSKMTKRRIEDIIESIPGVHDVENRLKVKPTENTLGAYTSDIGQKGSTNGS